MISACGTQHRAISTGSAPNSELIEALGDPNSPEHNEQAYLNALQQAVNNGNIDADNRIRYEALLNVAQKNAVGSEATDFTVWLPDGSLHRLSDYRGKRVLIFFNDPECDACHMVKHRIANSEIINAQVNNGTLIVLGVYPYEDKQTWLETDYPPIIINGFNDGSIDTNELYSIPMIPIFYVVSPEGIVEIKNEPSLTTVERYLAQ